MCMFIRCFVVWRSTSISSNSIVVVVLDIILINNC